MADNYVQPGDVLELTAPSGGVVSGTAYKIGNLFVVALGTVAATLPFRAAVTGVWTLPKTSAQAWTEGQRIYWDAGNSRCDSDGTLGMLIGVAAAVADNPSSTGSVKLNGTAPDQSEGPQAAIASLTEGAGAIGGTNDGDLPALTVTSNTITDNAGGTPSTTAIAVTSNTITDNTGGTPSTTAIANLADGTTYANDHAAIENNFATLNAELELVKADLANAIATLNAELELVKADLADAIAAVREVATKDNAILAALRAAGIIAT